MIDVYTLPLEQVKQLAVIRGIDPVKFKEATLRRMVATRLKREARNG